MKMNSLPQNDYMQQQPAYSGQLQKSFHANPSFISLDKNKEPTFDNPNLFGNTSNFSGKRQESFIVDDRDSMKEKNSSMTYLFDNWGSRPYLPVKDYDKKKFRQGELSAQYLNPLNKSQTNMNLELGGVAKNDSSAKLHGVASNLMEQLQQSSQHNLQQNSQHNLQRPSLGSKTNLFSGQGGQGGFSSTALDQLKQGNSYHYLPQRSGSRFLNDIRGLQRDGKMSGLFNQLLNNNQSRLRLRDSEKDPGSGLPQCLLGSQNNILQKSLK
mmetsp:Transcript_9975/g.15069  ORF Transcript_9975/g.15069 Transcript_9975/m.15069 type:complete len:269 (-) Transcript_9975:420-1226(-)